MEMALEEQPTSVPNGVLVNGDTETEDRQSTGSRDTKAPKHTKDKKKDKKYKQLKKGSVADRERFAGEGVLFKAKLIGAKNVPQARGEKMAQDTLQELKTQKKNSGEHKQKIQISINLEGLKLRDEKSGMLIHFHAVHKISFISQDSTDSRALAYIYGAPDNVHTLFALKTEKAAQQMVMCMRDLFQIAYELKKKEIEEKQKQNEHYTKEADSDEKSSNSSSHESSSSSSHSDSGSGDDASGPMVVENLLLDLTFDDVEQPRGDLFSPADPFSSGTWGLAASSAPVEEDDPFIVMENPLLTKKSSVPLLAPPPSMQLPTISFSAAPISDTVSPVTPYFRPNDPFNTSFVAAPPRTSTPLEPKNGFIYPNYQIFPSVSSVSALSGSGGSSSSVSPSMLNVSPLSANLTSPGSFGSLGMAEPISDILNKAFIQQPFPTQTESTNPFLMTEADEPPALPPRPSSTPLVPAANLTTADLESLFKELDPLGKDKPYIDKKDFFSDVKNPPKKVLKDLVEEKTSPTASPMVSPTSSPFSDNVSVFNGTNHVGLIPPPPATVHRKISLTNKDESPVESAPIPRPKANLIQAPSQTAKRTLSNPMVTSKADVILSTSLPTNNRLNGFLSHTDSWPTTNGGILPPPKSRIRKINMAKSNGFVKHDPFADDDFFAELSSNRANNCKMAVNKLNQSWCTQETVTFEQDR